MTGVRLYRGPSRTPGAQSRGRVDRLSFPLFLDPAWDAEVLLSPGSRPRTRATARIAGTAPACTSGQEPTGDYLLTKVGRVFPGLRDEVL